MWAGGCEGNCLSKTARWKKGIGSYEGLGEDLRDLKAPSLGREGYQNHTIKIF
jgi:hypothetical protein